MGPVINPDEAEFDDVEESGLYASKRATLGARIGAKKLGYNPTVLPPGKAQCPFHSHRGEEEMFFIIEGEGELRFGDKRFPLRANDVVACLCGGPEVAHQIVNTGTTTMRYLSLSNIVDVEICEYPDGGKIGVYSDPPAGPRLRKRFRAETDVDYYDREKTKGGVHPADALAASVGTGGKRRWRVKTRPCSIFCHSGARAARTRSPCFNARDIMDSGFGLRPPRNDGEGVWQ